ncbi:leucyl aminopeptidase, partial [bacterium]|nr:leucyl aminopeptidase [bacterium]
IETARYQNKNLKDFVHQGSLIGQAMHYTRHLAETPSNVCTPSYLAKKAQDLAKLNKKIQVSVLTEKEIKALKMNSFLSVSKGSTQAPKFITLQYKGSKKAPIVFIGKGITFDTGGHSLKPAASMMGMKFDMSGAATVLGLFQFLAAYEPDISIIGLIPSCENIPGTDANKPDDIVTSMSGQTIEILNTDAEGRLILCDAMTYAERFEPSYVIDIATLTGACLATFATVATAVMSNNDELSQKLISAAHSSTDKAWPLPLWDEYQDLIKSPVADMANIGGAYAGSITAGCFLSRFAKAYKWAHLDIAGTACIFQGHKRGSTGRPLPLLIEFLLTELNQS